MMKILKNIIFISLIYGFLSCSNHKQKIDLAIKNVQIFDSKSKQILKNKDILVVDDIIFAIRDSDKNLVADKILDGENKLIVPGFIDTHIHLTDIIGDYDRAPEYLSSDSIRVYKKRLADEYLSHGVTTLRDAGHPEKWLKHTIIWQNNSEPNIPNIILSGSAIISDEERTPYLSHVEVKNPHQAANKVQEYYDLGIRQVKLYWRLRLPEMKSVVNKAQNLGMNIFGHIDFNVVSIQEAMKLGVKHFEHAYTPFMSIFNYQKHGEDFYNKHKLNFPKRSFWTEMLNIFRYVDSNPSLKSELDHLVLEMARNKTTLCTSINLFGSIVNRTIHRSFMQTKTGDEENFNNFTDKQINILNQGFNALMEFYKKSHDKGVKLRIGTDCIKGGKAALSEMILLYECGFNVKDILQIATINGAEAINQDAQYGSIEIGKKADLVIFNKNPFKNYKNLLAEKIVIKDGRIFNN